MSMTSRPHAELFSIKARRAFGKKTVPDWVMVLAEFADEFGLGGAADKIGYSRAALSTVLSGKYRGTWANVEAAVRGALMGINVECPVLGEIGLDKCLFWQRRQLSVASPQSIKLFHACRGGCPHAQISGGKQ